MAIALDATGTGYSTRYASVTSVSYTGLTTTVATTTTNGAIVVCIINEVGSPGASTVKWDPTGANQSFTQIGQASDTSGNYYITYWGLVGPTTYGNKTIAITQTNAPPTTQVAAISLTGVNQTGGTSSFAGFTSNAPASASTTATVTISSSTNDLVLAAAFVASNGSGNLSAPNQTLIFDDNTNQVWGWQYASGASSVTSSWTISASYTYAAIAVNVLPASSVVTLNLSAQSNVKFKFQGLQTGQIKTSGQSTFEFLARPNQTGKVVASGRFASKNSNQASQTGKITAAASLVSHSTSQSSTIGKIVASGRMNDSIKLQSGAILKAFLTGTMVTQSSFKSSGVLKAFLTGVMVTKTKFQGSTLGQVTIQAYSTMGLQIKAAGSMTGKLLAVARLTSVGKALGTAGGYVSIFASSAMGIKTSSRGALTGSIPLVGRATALLRSQGSVVLVAKISGSMMTSVRSSAGVIGQTMMVARLTMATPSRGALNGVIRASGNMVGGLKASGSAVGKIFSTAVAQIRMNSASTIGGIVHLAASGVMGVRVSARGSFAFYVHLAAWSSVALRAAGNFVTKLGPAVPGYSIAFDSLINLSKSFDIAGFGINASDSLSNTGQGSDSLTSGSSSVDVQSGNSNSGDAI